MTVTDEGATGLVLRHGEVVPGGLTVEARSPVGRDVDSDDDVVDGTE